MHERKVKVKFHSPLADLMARFLREKQACGYLYERESYELLRLDRFLCRTGLKIAGLPRDIVDEWTAKQANEKPGTQQLRVIRIRQFALFLRQQGLESYVPEARTNPRQPNRVHSPHLPSRGNRNDIAGSGSHAPGYSCFNEASNYAGDIPPALLLRDAGQRGAAIEG